MCHVTACLRGAVGLSASQPRSKRDATLDDNSTVPQHFSCQRINTSAIKEIGVSMSKINADHSEKSKRS